MDLAQLTADLDALRARDDGGGRRPDTARSTRSSSRSWARRAS